MPWASAVAAATCVSRKSVNRPAPPPFSVPNAATKRSRSAGVNVCAFLRTRTVTRLEPSTVVVAVRRAWITASPRATLGRPNSPATKNETGAPVIGRLSANVVAPRCVRVVANLTRPPPVGPALRSVIANWRVPLRVDEAGRRLDGRPRQKVPAQRVGARNPDHHVHRCARCPHLARHPRRACSAETLLRWCKKCGASDLRAGSRTEDPRSRHRGPRLWRCQRRPESRAPWQRGSLHTAHNRAALRSTSPDRVPARAVGSPISRATGRRLGTSRGHRS